MRQGLSLCSSSWPGTYHVDQGDVDSQRSAGTCFFSAGMKGVSIAGVVYLAVWLHPDCVTVKGYRILPTGFVVDGLCSTAPVLLSCHQLTMFSDLSQGCWLSRHLSVISPTPH